MNTLALIIFASIAESLISFLVSLAVILNESRVRNFVHWFISFAVGALLGVVFFDVLPETFEAIGTDRGLPWVLSGFLFFFVLEKFLYWYHCHEEGVGIHPVGYLVTVGDAVHNFIDGVIIALTFAVSTELGTISTIAVLLHEVPQEASDFIIMIHSGFTKRKALLYNVMVSFMTLAGALFGYFAPHTQQALGLLLAIVAGNFLYLAAADLIPELHHKHKSSSSLLQITLVLMGVLFIYAFGVLVPE